MCTHIYDVKENQLCFVRKRAVLWNDNVLCLSTPLPFAYFLLLLKVKLAINTMVVRKVRAPGCICTGKATRYAIHHCNDSFEITTRCIDKWFSLGDKAGTKKRNKKTWRLCFFLFFFLLLLDIKISRWFLWFVAFARGHVVMKVLAFSMHLVKELCLMPHWFDIFHFFGFMVPTWPRTGGLLSRHQAMCWTQGLSASQVGSRWSKNRHEISLIHSLFAPCHGNRQKSFILETPLHQISITKLPHAGWKR